MTPNEEAPQPSAEWQPIDTALRERLGEGVAP